MTADPTTEPRPPDNNACASCGTPLRQVTARTGSVNHPPKPARTCPQCGGGAPASTPEHPSQP